jgi:hypothetical protein
VKTQLGGKRSTLEVAKPPNTPLELTPLRVERDRGDFESWSRLDRFPDQAVRRSSAAGRSAANTTYTMPTPCT